MESTNVFRLTTLLEKVWTLMLTLLSTTTSGAMSTSLPKFGFRRVIFSSRLRKNMSELTTPSKGVPTQHAEKSLTQILTLPPRLDCYHRSLRKKISPRTFSLRLHRMNLNLNRMWTMMNSIRKIYWQYLKPQPTPRERHLYLNRKPRSHVNRKI